jgi:Protein of unknwon function (DUF3008)
LARRQTLGGPHTQSKASHASEIKSTANGGRGRPLYEARRKKVEELKGASRSMYESMNEQQLEEMASAKRKGKPTHKSKS